MTQHKTNWTEEMKRKYPNNYRKWLEVKAREKKERVKYGEETEAEKREFHRYHWGVLSLKQRIKDGDLSHPDIHMFLEKVMKSKEHQRIWRMKNKEQQKIYRRAWYKKNREKWNQYQKDYQKEKRSMLRELNAEIQIAKAAGENPNSIRIIARPNFETPLVKKQNLIKLNLPKKKNK